MGNYRFVVKIANTENDKIESFCLPVTEETLKEKIQINNFDDNNLLLLSMERYSGLEVKKLIDSKIEQKEINIKTLNQISEIMKDYNIDDLIVLNALISIGKIKTPQDIIKGQKYNKKYSVIYYGTELEKERLGNYIYNEFPHKKTLCERSEEYRLKLVDDFHKTVKGEFTKYGYLVKDFKKIKAKCTNKGFQIMEEGQLYEEEG